MAKNHIPWVVCEHRKTAYPPFFSLLYGKEHSKERKHALGKLVWFHDQRPELPTVNFLVDAWNRACYEYTETVREGVRTLLRLLPDGATRDSFVALALGPYRGASKRLWRWPNVFSFSASTGMWRGRLLPEVEERLESSRILGSSQLRPSTFLGDTPVVSSLTTESAAERKRRLRKQKQLDRTLTGGPQGQVLDQPLSFLNLRSVVITRWGETYDQPNSTHLKNTAHETRKREKRFVGTSIPMMDAAMLVTIAPLGCTDE